MSSGMKRKSNLNGHINVNVQSSIFNIENKYIQPCCTGFKFMSVTLFVYLVGGFSGITLCYGIIVFESVDLILPQLFSMVVIYVVSFIFIFLLLGPASCFISTNSFGPRTSSSFIRSNPYSDG